jgi:hypothetical protein
MLSYTWQCVLLYHAQHWVQFDTLFYIAYVGFH